MAYEFRLRMTGVVGLVTGGGRVRVVLPNALMGAEGSGPRRRRDKRKAIDGRPLIRHEPVIQVGDVVLASPRGHRIVVDLGTSHPPLSDELGTLPRMAEVTPDHCALGPEYLEPSDPSKVCAVLDIEAGRVVATPPPSLEAELDRIDGTGPGARPMAGDFYWIVPMEDDERVRISLEPFDGSSGPVTVIEVDGRSGAGDLLLANLTAQIGGKQPDPPREDYDFLWYYECLSPDGYEAVRKALKKNRRKKAPVPICVEGCADGAEPGDVTVMSITGQKCRPCVFC